MNPDREFDSSYNRVAVYCASSRDVRPVFMDAAEELGRLLGSHGRDIVYGGGNIGLMGRLADAAIEAGGNVIGVIPRFMMDLELGHKRISQLKVVGDMHERQNAMIRGSDCVIALPGGCGTFMELLEAISWKKLGLILSPIIIVNIDNYYDPLVEMLDRAIDEKFMKADLRHLWRVAANAREAADLVEEYLPKFEQIEKS
ncbi:MAG: TIGR00730 family Rossman fold protein [Candidatus Kapaibacterium sp.]